MNWILLALLSTSPLAHATTAWTLPCRKSGAVFEVRVEPEVWTNYACTEGTGPFAHQFSATFASDATVVVNDERFSVAAGAPLGLIHRISCELLQREFATQETIVGITAVNSSRRKSARLFRNFDGYLTVHLYVGDTEVGSCEGFPRR